MHTKHQTHRIQQHETTPVHSSIIYKCIQIYVLYIKNMYHAHIAYTLYTKHSIHRLYSTSNTYQTTHTHIYTHDTNLFNIQNHITPSIFLNENMVTYIIFTYDTKCIQSVYIDTTSHPLEEHIPQSHHTHKHHALHKN